MVLQKIAKSVALVLFCCLTSNVFASYQTITNDVWWKDNNGNPIMAQGGGISKFGNTYYWYGVQYAEMGAVLHERHGQYQQFNLFGD